MKPPAKWLTRGSRELQIAGLLSVKYALESVDFRHGAQNSRAASRQVHDGLRATVQNRLIETNLDEDTMINAIPPIPRWTRPDPTSVFGPYSPWTPRRRFGRNAAIAGSVGTLAVFVHCVVQMIA